MVRVIITAVLITSLLVCPLICCSSQLEAAPDGLCPQSACCCGEPQQVETPAESQQDETDSEGGCSCLNCICEGATLHEALEITAADPEHLVDHWINAADERRTAVAAALSQLTDRPFLFPFGRGAPISFQVWLI